MRVVLQRVKEASVTVNEEVTGKIGAGLLILAGFEAADTLADIDWMVGKILRLRLFSDENGVMNRNVQEAGGALLAVSQFTLFASVKKGNRPSWSRAAKGEVSQPLFEQFVAALAKAANQHVATGRFGADMAVALINDGPVTLTIDSRQAEEAQPGWALHERLFGTQALVDFCGGQGAGKEVALHVLAAQLLEQL